MATPEKPLASSSSRFSRLGTVREIPPYRGSPQSDVADHVNDLSLSSSPTAIVIATTTTATATTTATRATHAHVVTVGLSYDDDGTELSSHPIHPTTLPTPLDFDLNDNNENNAYFNEVNASLSNGSPLSSMRSARSETSLLALIPPPPAAAAAAIPMSPSPSFYDRPSSAPSAISTDTDCSTSTLGRRANASTASTIIDTDAAVSNDHVNAEAEAGISSSSPAAVGTAAAGAAAAVAVAAGGSLSSRKAFVNRIVGPTPTPSQPKSAGGKH